MAIQVNRLAFGLGAEVSGLDLSRHHDHGTNAAIRQAWLQHQVLVFPGQDITLEQHIAFSRRFGELEVHPEKHYRHAQYPEIFEVTNRMVDGKKSLTAEVGLRWHSDGAFTLRPPTGSLLHCVQLPSVGGDTWFTNMYMAYDTLSPTLRGVVEGLHVVNDLASYTVVKQLDEHLHENPAVVQPLVRTHPETGRKALYLSETVTRQIHGMTREESMGLLQYLFQHCVRPQFTYRHRWRKHDLVMWDNRCTMHLAAGDYDRREVRQMYRTTLMGDAIGVLEAQAGPATASA